MSAYFSLHTAGDIFGLVFACGEFSEEQSVEDTLSMCVSCNADNHNALLQQFYICVTLPRESTTLGGSGNMFTL